MNFKLPYMTLGQQVVAYGFTTTLCLFAGVVNAVEHQGWISLLMVLLAGYQGFAFINSFKEWSMKIARQEVRNELTAQKENEQENLE